MKKIITLLVLAAFLGTGYGCANKAQQGAGIGALAGATIGALTFKNKLSGAAIGAGVGLLMGYIVGNEWDKHDESQIQNTLETGRSDQAHAWTNPDTGKSYTATPSAPYMQENRVYRDVVISENGPNGEKVMAKAYRDENGEWRLKQ
ncbi:YMGG-like glycine zipper-containing protein [Pseudodesulfovibrio senegalensis]|uniref:Glycine zipper 2TM domain-containing protein n=1 Tax=Pseudodesulfovibrio senegalensis TaxID=1721087 RepID=A0A6N6N5I7_9BACT|nr:YMGG-like glycine zipper-containing protein [Pseudodesulfovibrio senegalensis]KAB1443324.1 glycine zipper 2TM domain-containing protein [Pseudodesulfovibrio senegalensis]